MRQIEIFDTTLRDGEQAPGAALTAAAKLEVARALADLGVGHPLGHCSIPSMVFSRKRDPFSRT